MVVVRALLEPVYVVYAELESSYAETPDLPRYQNCEAQNTAEMIDPPEESRPSQQDNKPSQQQQRHLCARENDSAEIYRQIAEGQDKGYWYQTAEKKEQTDDRRQIQEEETEKRQIVLL